MIDTRLTRMFGLTCPVVLAPLPGFADGRLAAAVARAGGLGLLGAGDCDEGWMATQFRAAKTESIGCGFTTWQLAQNPDLLDRVLDRRPRAIFLSHGDPRRFAPVIARAGVRLICQVQDLESAAQAVEAGADVVVAQGSASAGVSGARSTMALLPELADFLYREAHDTLLLAAGGIADSRGLAACIVMGADGVVMGTRLLASREGSLQPAQIAATLGASGDDTVRCSTTNGDWPGTALDRRLGDLPASEAVGLIGDNPSVEDILATITQKAERLLVHCQRKVIP